MAITISAETPLQDDVRAMVADLNATMIPLTPREFQFQLTAEQMAEPSVTVFVARDEAGRHVGMGSLKDHGGGLGEVKRMWTDPEIRGKRIGSALLNAIEGLAREKGLGVLMLETGGLAGMEAAHRLYQRAGFVQRGPYLDYPDSEWSVFYEKPLRQPALA